VVQKAATGFGFGPAAADFGQRDDGASVAISGQNAKPLHQAAVAQKSLSKLGICFWGLVFEIWNFFGAWDLVLGVSLSRGS
jgi:hypothetical protein